MRNTFLNLAIVACLVALISCGGGGGGGGNYTAIPSKDKVEDFVDLLEYTYGGSFVWMKKDTLTEGFVVVWDNELGDYYSYDITNFQVGDTWNTYVNSYDYKPVLIDETYYDIYGEKFYVGDTFAWAGSYEGRFVFERKTISSRDLRKMKNAKFLADNTSIRAGMKAEGHSSAVIDRVSKMQLSWRRFSANNSQTNADANAVVKAALGITMDNANAIVRSFSEGDTAPLQNFLEEAAKLTGSTPEDLGSFISDLTGAELN